MDNSVIVSLRDIVVEFDGQRILDGLNLDIHDKEFVTLLGSSGCGKTTTLRLIAGFLEPNSGKVLLKGQDITVFARFLSLSPAKIVILNRICNIYPGRVRQGRVNENGTA